jgi:hypothetical protein
MIKQIDEIINANVVRSIKQAGFSNMFFAVEKARQGK